jgi:hypothetical protein
LSGDGNNPTGQQFDSVSHFPGASGPITNQRAASMFPTPPSAKGGSKSNLAKRPYASLAANDDQNSDIATRPNKIAKVEGEGTKPTAPEKKMRITIHVNDTDYTTFKVH